MIPYNPPFLPPKNINQKKIKFRKDIVNRISIRVESYNLQPLITRAFEASELRRVIWSNCERLDDETRVSRRTVSVAHDLKRVLAFENGAETVSACCSQSGRAPSAPRKINISCANERWAFLGAKERSDEKWREGRGEEEKWEKQEERKKNGNIGLAETQYRFSERRNNLYIRTQIVFKSFESFHRYFAT